MKTDEEYEALKQRGLKTYQFMLLENKKLKDELDEANRTIEVYINKCVLHIKQPVDK